MVDVVFRISILYDDDDDNDDDDDDNNNNNNKPQTNDNSCSKDKIVKITSQICTSTEHKNKTRE